MPTRAVSATIHELRGNPSKSKHKDFKPSPLVAEMPDWLSPVGRSIWRHYAPELSKNALLTKLDREAFAFLCEDVSLARAALDDMRPDKRKGYKVTKVDLDHKGRVAKSASFAIYRAAVDSFRKGCVQFGLSPRSRIGMDVGGDVVPDDDDSDDDLFD